jgi:hypothetical protein
MILVKENSHRLLFGKLIFGKEHHFAPDDIDFPLEAANLQPNSLAALIARARH